MKKHNERQPQRSRFLRALAFVCLVVVSMNILTAPVAAQFDPSKVKAEPTAVALLYPDPSIQYQTPGLAAERADFASHQEVLDYLRNIASKHPQITAELIGKS